MLPHARDSRSSDSWSQVWSAPIEGAATSRSPSAISWRVRSMSSSRVTGSPVRGSSPWIIASRAARARSVHAPGRPSPIGAPSNDVTGRIPATLDDRKASRAAARSARVSAPSNGRNPAFAPQSSSHDRVVPGRIAQSSEGVASSRASPPEARTRKMLADVPSDRRSSTVRKSASSAPARRASSRA